MKVIWDLLLCVHQANTVLAYDVNTISYYHYILCVNVMHVSTLS